MSKVQVRLLYFVNSITTQQYVLSLNDDCTLQQVSQYLYSQWKVLKQPHALYSISNKDPQSIPQNITIRQLASGRNQLTLYLVEADNLKAVSNGKKCCLLF